MATVTLTHSVLSRAFCGGGGGGALKFSIDGEGISHKPMIMWRHEKLSELFAHTNFYQFRDYLHTKVYLRTLLLFVLVHVLIPFRHPPPG